MDWFIPRKRRRIGSKVMYNAGRVAADTLGFITGDIPGALMADRAYTKLTHTKENPKSSEIVSTGMKRRRNASRKSRRSGRKRKTGKAKSQWKKKSAKYNRNDGSDNIQYAHLRSGRRVSSKAKGRKSLKLSKHFKKAVKQVIRNFSPKGYFTERYYARYTPGNMVSTVYDLGEGWTGAASGRSFDPATSASGAYLFDPVKIMDAASCLFHGKEADGNKSLANSGQFDQEFFEVDVMRQWCRMEMKNNTSRTLIMKLYTWQLRNANDALTNGSFADEWAAQALLEGNQTNGNLNITAAGIGEFGMSPNFSPAVRKRFSIEEKEVRLESGKTYVHLVQGASQLYSYAEFRSGNQFNNCQKMVKGVCLALSVDVVGSTAAIPGTGESSTLNSHCGAAQRWTGLSPWNVPGPYGLLVETTFNYVIRIPEQAGFKLPSDTIGTNIFLDNRLNHPYYVKVWNQVDMKSGTFEKSDEEPLQASTFGV